MKLPNGWQEWDPNCSVNNRPIQCGDCGWEGFEDDIDDHYIHDLTERIGPGDFMPYCECPQKHMCSKDGEYRCGALVYYSDTIVAYHQAPTVLDEIAEAISG